MPGPEVTCDPATRGATFNLEEMAVANGAVLISVRSAWDGVSTRETGCDGPILRAHIENVTDLGPNPATWYVHYEGKRGQPRTLELPPGFTATRTGAQLANWGLELKSDMWALNIDQTP